jgi:hypothetical protein
VSKTKLGFVHLKASEVVERAEGALKRIADKREVRRKEFLSDYVNQPVCWLFRLFGKKPLTEEQAIKAIEEDMWLGHHYYYLTPDFESPWQEGLRSLVKVGNGLLESGETEMEVSIEYADLLF